MGLIKYDALKFTPSEIAILEANNGIKIKEQTKASISAPLRNSIVQGLIILGQGKELTSQQVNTLTDCLVYELKENKSNLSIEEVLMAIDMGCKNKLTEITKLTMPVMSLVNVLKFINLYLETVRKEVIHKRNELEAREEKQINEVERLAKIKAFEQEIAKALLFTQEQLDSLPMGLKASYFRHLDKTTKIEITEKQEIAIYHECSKRVPTVKRSEIGAFCDLIHEGKKREALIQELCESKAFEVIALNLL